MALFHFHRILVAAAILFDVAYTFFSINRWQKLGHTSDLVMAVVSTLITIAFIAYLIRFNKKMRRWQAEGGIHPPDDMPGSKSPSSDGATPGAKA